MKHVHIPLEGTPNMRDLGGIPTLCGRKTRFNKLFRSGTLGYLSNSDWSKLSSLNINVICDFRSEQEIKHEPICLPESSSARIVELSINAGSYRDSFKRLNHETADDTDVRSIMDSMYRHFATDCVPLFSQFIQQVLALPPDAALLFHCTSGKDRTGFAAAILLACLNVERELIEQEYTLTERYFLPERDLKRITQNNPLIDFDIDLLRPMHSANKQYIRAALDAIDDHWGDINSYIRSGLGIHDDARRHMQESLLDIDGT